MLNAIKAFAVNTNRKPDEEASIVYQHYGKGGLKRSWTV